MKKRIKKGFTLVELLVVIAILAILSTVAIVGYNSFTEKAQKSADQQTVTQLNTVVEGEIVSGKKLTGVEAYEAIVENGYDGGFKTKYGAYSMAWYEEEQTVVLVTSEAIAYPEEFAGTSLDKVSPLYTVQPSTEKELEAAFAGNGSNYVNINIPETGLVVSKTLNIAKNVTAVIDLDGDISGSYLYAKVKVFGDLTINGNGKQIVTVNPQPGSNVVINNAKVGYEDSRCQAIGNYGGNIEVNDSILVNNSYNTSTTGNNGSYVVINNSGKTILNNCTFEGKGHGVFAIATGEIVVNGGTYTLKAESTGHIFYAPSGHIEVNGGTFTQENANNFVIYAEHDAGGAASDVVTVKGGTFNGAKYYFNGATTLDAFKA